MTLGRTATRAYTLAMRAFPPGHRGCYAGEMLDTFTRELAAQQSAHGGMRGLRFTVAACLDALSAGLGERRRCRPARSLDGVMAQCRISWPDIRLSARLLIKYPGLTLVASLGITVAVTICAAFFSFFSTNLYPTLPLEDGDRIVALENWSVSGNNEERHSLHDFVTWRQELKSVVEISAWQDVEASLVIGNESAAAVKIAAMTASGFRVARVPPLLGRHLLEDDEREGAAPVLVIGYDAWRTRFAQDQSVIGQKVRLGATVHTVVGVMPERFGFPLNHQYWTALRANPLAVARGEGPVLFIFGRLAPGATMETAQAELATIGRNSAAAFPKTHAELKPQVLPYTRPLLDIQEADVEAGALKIQVAVSLLLVVVALNVAILVYARTALRRGEIAVRTALGASRSRLVAQFFAEAFLLAIGPAVLGLALSQAAWRLGNDLMLQDLGADSPFWADYSLRPATMLYTAALVVLAAAIVGVLPALQATRRRKESDVRQLGGGTGPRLGRMWTTMVVAQVAVAVAVLPAAVKSGLNEISFALTRPTFDADTFVWARLATNNGDFGERLAEVMRGLRAEAGVAGVTFASGVRGRSGRLPLEVEGVTAAVRSDHGTVSVGVDRGYFDVYGARVLAGRNFETEDTGAGSRAIIVNRSFVRKVLGGANALGRRVRFASEVTASGRQYGPWYEIVGVVDNLRTNPIDADLIQANVYFAVAPQQLRVATIAVRMRAHDAPTVGAKLREITTAVDPALRLDNLSSGMAQNREGQLAVRLVGLLLSVILLTVFVFSAAGVYALMSFTVTQRRREIGIRAALGASPRRLLIAIFSRVMSQIVVGLVAGVAAAVAIDSATGNTARGDLTAMVLPAVALTMAVVGCLAAIGPTRRGLETQPTEALRAE